MLLSKSFNPRVKPIGSIVQFPDTENQQASPIYKVGDAHYLKSGHVLGEEYRPQYLEAFDKFSTGGGSLDVEAMTFESRIDQQLQDIEYGGGAFVLVPRMDNVSNSVLRFSTDGGLNWFSSAGTPSITPVNGWSRVKYNNGAFMLISSQSTANQSAVTTDMGASWPTEFRKNLPSTLGNWDLYSGNNAFVIVERRVANKRVMFTTDLGVTWQLGVLPGSSGTSSITLQVLDGQEDGSIYMRSPNSAALYRSTDNGLTWTTSTLPQHLSYVFGGTDGRILGMSGSTSIFSSDFGATWETNPGSAPRTSGVSIVQQRDIFATASLGGSMLTTNTNGKTWHEISGLPTAAWIKAIFAEDTYICVAGPIQPGNANQPTYLRGTLSSASIGIPTLNVENGMADYLRIK